MSDHPNEKALNEALGIYRDEMRKFIVWWLKRVLGKKVEDAIKHALKGDPLHQFEKNLSEGRKVEDAIDISHFPWIVKRYRWDLFGNAFKSDENALNALFKIVEARNEVMHPRSEDIGLKYALDRMDDIAATLVETNKPEESRNVEEIRMSLMPFSTPAHRFKQGGRDVYAFSLDLETLDSLLPDRVDDRVVKDANRPLTPSHAKKIQGYLEKHSDEWLLGTLLLGISPEDVDFQSYMADSDSHNVPGLLTISNDAAKNMKMFDGQHRRRAVRDVLEDLSHKDGHSEQLRSLKEASIPVMLYVEGEINALRQMFADAAQTRTIERNTVTRFDRRSALNLAAMWIAENSDLFNDRVEMERTSVAKNSPNLISINQLAMALRTVLAGYKGRISRELNDAYMLKLDEIYEQCLTWSDDFMLSARDEYDGLVGGEIEDSEIPGMRTTTMAYNATVIRILAGCYYEWTKDGDDWKELAEFLRNASLKPGVMKDSLLVDAGAVVPGGTSPYSPIATTTKAIDYIVRLAKAS